LVDEEHVLWWLCQKLIKFFFLLVVFTPIELMSAHEGVSCDTCGKSNFRSKRYKCLICYDYDLCSTCYEQGETSSNHANEHPMQCKFCSREREKNNNDIEIFLFH